jgi:hypothetical protein
MTTGLCRRLRRLERRHQPAGGRVCCVWWRRGDRQPGAAPGERLHVHRWAEDGEGGDGGTPALPPTGAAR